MIPVVFSVTVNISSDSGKVEMVFEKRQAEEQWSSVGKYLDKHNKYVPYKEFSKCCKNCVKKLVNNDLFYCVVGLLTLHICMNWLHKKFIIKAVNW